MLRTEGTYYARTEHGGHRVVADNTGFLVSWPGGSVRYPSARQTIIALVNRTPAPARRARDPKLTFDRYFRQGSFRPSEPAFDTLSLFQGSPALTVAKRAAVIHTSTALSVAAAPIGVDLARRGHEVRKLFFAGFGRRVARYGYDPEDVLQEIYKGLLVRNGGKCPFDPNKSSFGHYVHMVCGCIVSNYHRRYSRLSRNEVIGVVNHDNELEDVATADLASVGPLQADLLRGQSLVDRLTEMTLSHTATTNLNPNVVEECVQLLSAGFRKSEIATHTGQTPHQVAKILRIIRTVGAEWRSLLQ